jgi:hypothetical protein
MFCPKSSPHSLQKKSCTEYETEYVPPEQKHQEPKISTGRVDWPITNHLPITEHLFISSSYVLHFEWFKMLGSTTSSSRNHLWSANERNYEKIKEEK